MATLSPKNLKIGEIWQHVFEKPWVFHPKNKLASPKTWNFAKKKDYPRPFC
jgi:hypothetical protein